MKFICNLEILTRPNLVDHKQALTESEQILLVLIKCLVINEPNWTTVNYSDSKELHKDQKLRRIRPLFTKSLETLPS